MRAELRAQFLTFRVLLARICKQEKWRNAAVALLITGAAFFFIGLSFWKEANLRYNALDLAIYTNVLWNFTHGNGVYSSIQQSNYFGDHFEPLLLSLAPFFALFPSPKTLLVIQAVALALAGWPVYLIAQYFTKRRALSLIITALFLLNPLLANINAMEFHLLSLALPLLLAISYSYLAKRYSLFVLFSSLALMAREDISFVLFAFGLLALMDRRLPRWWMFPFIASISWFAASLAVTSFFSPSASYKFLGIYDWGGVSNLQAVATIFSQLGNYEMASGLLLAFLFMPLAAPRYLALAIPTLLQFLLIPSGASGDVLKAHYSVLFFPALVLAGIAGLVKLFFTRTAHVRRSICSILLGERTLAVIVLVILFVGSHWALGPTLTLVANATTGSFDDRVALRKAMVAFIDKNESCVGTLDVLTPLATRKTLSSFHYLFSGRKQLSFAPYTLPQDTNCFLLDGQELMGYPLQVQTPEETQKSYARTRELLLGGQFGLVRSRDGFLLFKKGGDGTPLYQSTVNHDLPKVSGTAPIQIENVSHREVVMESQGSVAFRFLKVNPAVLLSSHTNENYKLLLRLYDQEGRLVHESLYPLAGGLYPTSEWQTGERVEREEYFLIPQALAGTRISASLAIAKAEFFITLDATRSIERVAQNVTVVGDEFLLGEFSAQ